MKNSTIHHLINLKAGIHEFYGNSKEERRENLETLGVTVKEAHKMLQEPEMFLWGYGYEESQIGARRNWTKKDYKLMMHNIRKCNWEQYQHDLKCHSEDQYEPDLNPGGGPYHYADCK